MERYCPKCKKTIQINNPQMKFCSVCGSLFTNVKKSSDSNGNNNPNYNRQNNKGINNNNRQVNRQNQGQKRGGYYQGRNGGKVENPNFKNRNNQEIKVQATLRKRLPILILLDTSESMARVSNGGNLSDIKRLQNGVRLLFKKLKKDMIAKDACDICIITFNSIAVVKQDFEPVCFQNQDNLTLEASGYTLMGQAINLGLNLLDKRLQYYQKSHISYYEPVLVIMSDGSPEGPDGTMKHIEIAMSAVDEIHKRVQSKRLFPIPVAIGKDGVNFMQYISNENFIYLDKQKDFNRFFEYLHRILRDSSNGTSSVEEATKNNSENWDFSSNFDTQKS